jgi:hypothetical protein
VILADGKDEVIQDVERPEVPAEEQDTLVEEVQKQTVEKPADGSILEKNGEVENDTVTEEAKPMDVDAPRVDSKEVSAEESPIEPKEIKAEQIVAPGEEDVVVPAADVTKIDAPPETAPKALVPHVEVTPEPAVAADLKLEEPAKEQDPTEQVDPPQPQGVHPVVDGTAAFGEGPKPQEEVVKAPVDAPESTLGPAV